MSFTEGHHFTLAGEATVEQLAEAATVPLLVILQVTKRCNFDCSFCSETLQLPDPTLDALDRIRANLSGVQRVFLSGGEPLLRRDFGDVADLYSEFILGVPTNATRGLQHARRLVGKVAFVNVGLEGPRSTTNRVRGDYDQVMRGVRAFLDHGLPISLSAVVYRSTLHALPYTYQIADVVGAGKLKLILPLRKGNALDLEEHEFTSGHLASQRGSWPQPPSNGHTTTAARACRYALLRSIYGPGALEHCGSIPTPSMWASASSCSMKLTRRMR